MAAVRPPTKTFTLSARGVLSAALAVTVCASLLGLRGIVVKSHGSADETAFSHAIGVALAEGGNVLRQVGHNAIFAMLAIKAFRMLPSAATPQRIEGVCTMIRSFTPWVAMRYTRLLRQRTRSQSSSSKGQPTAG